MDEVAARAGILPRRPPRRSAVWSGVFLLLLIEATILSAFLVSYYYLRLGRPLWPPAGIELPELARPSIAAILLFGSGAFAFLVDRSLRAERIARIRWAMPLGLTLVGGYLLLTWLELAGLPFSYRVHAYASIFWTITAYTMAHAVVVLLLGGTVSVLLFLRPIGPRMHAAIEGAALYWAYVAFTSAPVFLVLHVSPYVI